MKSYPFVSFARNDPRNGAPLGQVWAISVQDLCELEGFPDGTPFAYTPVDLAVLINRERFPLEGYLTRWVGNWVWDGAPMAPDVLARLLAYLRDPLQWACVEAVTPLMERWDDPGSVTAAAFLEVIR